MSLAPHVDLFKGTNWKECDAFIRALRSRALWEGKQRDPAWIADFAAPYFSARALLWHSRLPQDVRQDWFKLEIALLERWAPPEEYDEATIDIAPTPAAAPSINRVKTTEHQRQYTLKVVLNESNNSHYIKFNQGDTVCSLTDDATEALRIICNSLSDATLLERIDGPCHSWLAIQWSTSLPGEGWRSTEYSRISLVRSDVLKSSWTASTLWQLMICKVTTEGEVKLFWRYEDTSKLELVPFVQNPGLLLVVDRDAWTGNYRRDQRAKLFIETID